MLAAVLFTAAGLGQNRRYVVIDQDAAGPAGTDMTSILLLLQSPAVVPLGITIVTGDGWRDEEVAHALRMLELIGRTRVPVVPGADFPLARTQRGTEQWEREFGRVAYKGAWDAGPNSHAPSMVPPLIEGNPAVRSSSAQGKEDAAHFLARMVRKYPGQVTVFALGPMTNLALALRLDPQFAQLSKGLVFMGGSLNPQTSDPEFVANPHREFNLWFDPEAAHAVLRARWPSIVCTTVDASVKTHLTRETLDRIAKAHTPAAQYVARYTHLPANGAGPPSYLWDELAAAAWIDPSIITSERRVYMDANLDRGAGYGETRFWPDRAKAPADLQVIRAQMDVNMPKLAESLVQRLTAPTPRARNPLMPLQ